MDICIITSFYLAMFQAHLAIPADHAKLAEGGKFLEAQCEEFKTKKKMNNAPKTGEAKIDKR